jgi:hypothetical protein
MKKSNYAIGNRTCDLLVCSAVPQPLCHRMPHKWFGGAPQMVWWLALIQWQHSIQLPMPGIQEGECSGSGMGTVSLYGTFSRLSCIKN